MNRHVNAISGRLSLRQPQRESLEISRWVCDSEVRAPMAVQLIRSP